eukprot:364986-Chlamydomonas_euryale.AAC.2
MQHKHDGPEHLHSRETQVGWFVGKHVLRPQVTPVTPAEPRPALALRHARKMPLAGGRGAFPCMHVHNLGSASASAGVVS